MNNTPNVPHSGIILPMATPFTAAEELDEAALRAAVQYMIEEAGVYGLVLGGSALVNARLIVG